MAVVDYEAQRGSSGGPTRFFKYFLRAQKKSATRTPRARPLAWCLVSLLAVVGLFWARSLAPLVLILVRTL